MSIPKILEKEEYKYFKFLSAKYFEDDDECDIVFLYPEGKNKPSTALKQQLANEVRALIADTCKTKVRFRQSSVDIDAVYGFLCMFLEKELPLAKSLVKKSDLTLKIVDENIVQITIECDNTTAELLNENHKTEKMSKFLQQYFFYDVIVKIENTKKAVVDENILNEQSPNADLYEALQLESRINKIDVDVLDSIVGKYIEGKPVFISDITLDDKETAITGFVSNIVESEFVPRSKKEKGLLEAKKKISFTLTDPTGSCEVVFFPTDKNIDDVRKLEETNQVIVSGVASSFNDKISFRADAIAYASVSTKEKKIVWRKERENYIFVKPEPMVDRRQMDLFSAAKKEENDFWKTHKSVVVFDFETTGFNAETCSIIEIGAVKVVNGVCTETFSTFVNPGERLPQEIIDLTHITDDMLVSAPTIDMVLPDFYKFCKGSVISAYNISFDNKFLQHNGKKLRLNFDNEKIDTLELARNKVYSVHNYKLGTVVKALDIVLEGAHRAINDAIATAKVFIKLI